MDDQNVVINLDLTVAEINVILRSLGKHPFEEIASLIAKIKAQGETQLKEIQANLNATEDKPKEEDEKEIENA